MQSCGGRKQIRPTSVLLQRLLRAAQMNPRKAAATGRGRREGQLIEVESTKDGRNVYGCLDRSHFQLVRGLSAPLGRRS